MTFVAMLVFSFLIQGGVVKGDGGFDLLKPNAELKAAVDFSDREIGTELEVLDPDDDPRRSEDKYPEDLAALPVLPHRMLHSFGSTNFPRARWFHSGTNPRGVESITVYAESVVTGLQLTFRNGEKTEYYRTDRLGYSGGSEATFNIPQQATISQLQVGTRNGRRKEPPVIITTLQIFTDSGESSPLFGSEMFDLGYADTPAGQELVGIEGIVWEWSFMYLRFMYGPPESIRSIELILSSVFEYSGFSLGFGFHSRTTFKGHASAQGFSSSRFTASAKARGLLASVFGNSGITGNARGNFDASLDATAEIVIISHRIFAMFFIPLYVYTAKTIVTTSTGDVHEYYDGALVQTFCPLDVTYYYKETFD